MLQIWGNKFMQEIHEQGTSRKEEFVKIPTLLLEQHLRIGHKGNTALKGQSTPLFI